MTKTNARAFVQCHNAIERALDACLSKLSEREREYAEAYWAGHIRGAINNAYGSMPYHRALETLDILGE